MRGAKPHASIEQTIERGGSVRRGERVVIACSGGADSVALAYALNAVRKPMELDLILGHVNHGTRESAWQDECVVLRAAASFGLPVRIAALDGCARDEAALREARYDALLAIAREAGASAIATAHHREDQSETVLLALLRGAGPDGLAGMRARRALAPGIDLVRPLLRTASQELRAAAHMHALPYAVDPGNADRGLRRNALRAALDALRPLFPGLDAAVARTAELLGDELAGTSRSDLRRDVRATLAAQEGLQDVDFEHVEAVVRAIERGGTGSFHMKKGVELRVERGLIVRER
ncbi:MAG TPA: tRNA lysidine(34) synthetase TilS [Candidatus Baltobacteraceae bacterium]|nr:tRNA lysidine(34) synthetase TilS [Candidatus Baltobacteraceae bacterium]